tara:strand:+ start:786 stop:1253 length:468 start_codon:yes stop_codon:yes gene_type:complete
MKNLILITGLITSCISGASFAEQETIIAFNQLPKAVQTTINKALAPESITKVEKIFDEEIIKYEIESSSSGVTTDITVAEDGSILEIESSAQQSSLSSTVLAAIKHDYPNLKFTEIELVQRFYTTVVGTVDGKTVSFNVLASGDIEDVSSKEFKD